MTREGYRGYRPPKLLSPAAADAAAFWHYTIPDRGHSLPRDPYLEHIVDKYRTSAEGRSRLGREVLRCKAAFELLLEGRYAPEAGSYVSPPVKVVSGWPAPKEPIVFTPLERGEETMKVDESYNTLHYFGYELKDYKDLPEQLAKGARWLRENRLVVAPITIAVTHVDMIEALKRYIPDLLEGIPICEVSGYPYERGVLVEANSARRIHGRKELPMTDPVYGFAIPTDEFIERCLELDVSARTAQPSLVA